MQTDIIEIDNFLSAEECEYFIKQIFKYEYNDDNNPTGGANHFLFRSKIFSTSIFLILKYLN